MGSDHSEWTMLYLIAEVVVQRGHLYNFKEQLGVLVPTNGLKKQLNQHLVIPNPFQDDLLDPTPTRAQLTPGQHQARPGAPRTPADN
jgi:hypothetical protein